MSKNTEIKFSALIVDDEEEIREGLVAFLECMDCWQFIIQASDGHEAYVKSQRQKFDLIVVDLKMPKWNGADFIKHCRQQESAKDNPAPVLFISGNFTPEDIKQAMDLKVKHFLSKPFNAETFLQKVEHILKTERNWKKKAAKKAA